MLVKESKWNHRKQEENLSPGNWSAILLEKSHTGQWCWSCHNLPETETSWGGWKPHGQLLGHHWARNVHSENLSHHQSHIHGEPQQLQLYSPRGDGCTQERTSVRGLKLERKCFTITPGQTKSQVNLSNNLELGNVPLFHKVVFCSEFLPLPSLSPGSLVSGQVCPVFQGTHGLGGEFEPSEH